MDRIEEIIRRMTLEEKISYCSGGTFWETKKYEKYGIPALFMCDGPHGLRKQEDTADMLGVNNSLRATCFPSEVTRAGSWNEEIEEEIGRAVGEEATAEGVGLVLGPGVNMKRNPLCGRNFEYYSEDPYLAGKMGAGFIRGIEKTGVSSSLKHFAVNSQEKSRFNSNSVIDERTLREIYLTAFEIAVKEGRPSTVMCAYPLLNGIHCSDSRKLLHDILRKEWKSDAMVVTDWGGLSDRIEAFRAGCDLSMPGGSDYMEKETLKAVREGRLSEEDIDASVRRILKIVFRAEETLGAKKECDFSSHHETAGKAAEEGAVLLKNEGSVLPLVGNESVAIVGFMAKDMRCQGAGSSHINPVRVSQPIDYIEHDYYAPGSDEDGNTTQELLEEVRDVSKKADRVIVFAGLPPHSESEGFDRDDMKMPSGHVRMIEAAAEANENTVVILFSGSAVECGWEDKVKGILYMGLPGEAGGEALSNLLYGRVSPSGKLSESWPLSYDDVPSSEIYAKTKDALYEEGIYMGYRYYDRAAVRVRWPFGFGLSYTCFSYSGLTADNDSVSVTVTNTGNREGKEVVLLFVSLQSSNIHRPGRELRGFRKISLLPGESRRVEIPFDEYTFRVWNDGWKEEKGCYTLTVGPLSTTLERDGEPLPPDEKIRGTWYETLKGKPSKDEWEKVTGIHYEEPVLRKGSFTKDNSVIEMKEYSLIMKIMFIAVERTVAKAYGGRKAYDNAVFRMQIASSAGSPLRSMHISGGMKGGVLPGMLEIANGHFFRGLLKMIRG